MGDGFLIGMTKPISLLRWSMDFILILSSDENAMALCIMMPEGIIVQNNPFNSPEEGDNPQQSWPSNVKAQLYRKPWKWIDSFNLTFPTVAAGESNKIKYKQ